MQSIVYLIVQIAPDMQILLLNGIQNTGVGLGCIAAGAKQITPDVMLAAAKAAAVKLTSEELEQGSILPQADRIRCKLTDIVFLHTIHTCFTTTNYNQLGRWMSQRHMPKLSWAQHEWWAASS